VEWLEVKAMSSSPVAQRKKKQRERNGGRSKKHKHGHVYNEIMDSRSGNLREEVDHKKVVGSMDPTVPDSG
jgi:hypothetical protein